MRDASGSEAEALVERTAREFHEAYERLAPSFGYETRKDSAVPWEQVPEKNRRLMVAVAGEVCASLRTEVERLQEQREEWRQDYIRVAGQTEKLTAENTSLRSRLDLAMRVVKAARALIEQTPQDHESVPFGTDRDSCALCELDLALDDAALDAGTTPAK